MNIVNLFSKYKKMMYTCTCCGYRTLGSNASGEICPVCYWEEDYFVFDDLFDLSTVNHQTLYQAQENFKRFHSCKYNLLKYCRNPAKYEKKDLAWQSVQDIIESRYCTVVQLINKIKQLCEILKRADACEIYQKFKYLHEIDIESDYEELELARIEFGHEINIKPYKQQLLLKSLLIALSKLSIADLSNLFSKYYRLGIAYYIAWAIMLYVLVEQDDFDLNENVIENIIDIEINDYYGLDSLQAKIKEYWHKQS